MSAKVTKIIAFCIIGLALACAIAGLIYNAVTEDRWIDDPTKTGKGLYDEYGNVINDTVEVLDTDTLIK